MENRIKPILFSTPMVQAIINNSKSQTRREIKSISTEMTAVMINALCGVPGAFDILMNYAPYQVGDVLWIRETYKIGAWKDDDDMMAFDYKASPELKKTPWVEFLDSSKFAEMHLKMIDELDRLRISPIIVDEKNEVFHYAWEPGQSPLKWKPSIFMPKEAARIFLKIVAVRPELLQDISPDDAYWEGIEAINEDFHSETGAVHADYKNYMWIDDESYEDFIFPYYSDPTLSFKSLWKSINGVESWERNPLVWAISFEVCDKPKDFLS